MIGTFKNTVTKKQSTYFNPGVYDCRIKEIKFLDETGSDGRPAFIVETEVVEVVRAHEDSNEPGSEPVWVHKPGKFHGGKERWREEMLYFWAAVEGLDRKTDDDVAKIEAAKESGIVDNDMAAAVDPKLQKYKDAMVRVVAREKVTKTGSFITLHSFEPVPSAP